MTPRGVEASTRDFQLTLLGDCLKCLIENDIDVNTVDMYVEGEGEGEGEEGEKCTRRECSRMASALVPCACVLICAKVLCNCSRSCRTSSFLKAHLAHPAHPVLLAGPSTPTRTSTRHPPLIDKQTRSVLVTDAAGAMSMCWRIERVKLSGAFEHITRRREIWYFL